LIKPRQILEKLQAEINALWSSIRAEKVKRIAGDMRDMKD
jgi:hypothetical protein